MNVLDLIPVYRPFGQPAYGYITVQGLPLTGATVTIGSDTFTYGTDFQGKTPEKIAQSLASAIRADSMFQYATSTQQPIRPYAAAVYGSKVFIYATEPGTESNSIVLAVSDSANFSKSGATLTNGTGAGAFIEALTSAVVSAISSVLTVRYFSTITNTSLDDVNDLNSLATAGGGSGTIPVGTVIRFNNADNLNVLEDWLLKEGTDAEVAHQKRRPADYNASTNAKFYERVN